MTQEATHSDRTADEIATRVLEIAREDRRDEKRDATGMTITEGVRVDAAPLTYKGASLEIDPQHIGGDDSVQVAVLEAVRQADDLEAFSTGFCGGDFWYASIKDESRTGADN